MAIPAWQAMTGEQVDHWEEMLGALAELVPAGAARVVVDGGHSHATVADRLAERLRAAGRRCVRTDHGAPAPEIPETVTLANGHPATGEWDVAIWLRTDEGTEDAEHDADIVLDLHDGTWPMICHVALRLASRGNWYLPESRAYFAAPAKSGTSDPATEMDG
jgi:hypothetical protein